MRCKCVTAIILCFNEAVNIRDCLESVQGFCRIMVLDSGSTDQTLDICREYTDAIFHHDYRSHASQWQWALDNLPIDTEWVFALDADFTVSDELKGRIESDLPSAAKEVSGIYVRHLYHFGGNLIRFGGTKQYWLRLIRLGRAYPDTSEMVDFRFVGDGLMLRWKETVIEYNRHDDDISTWISKQDKFSIRLALEEELRRSGAKEWAVKPRFFGHTDERITWLRDKWLLLPLYFRPVIYFIYRYLIALGFLDGKGGFLYHVLQGFWLRLIVDWKTSQLREMKLSTEELESFAQFCLGSRQGSVEILQGQWRAQSAGSPVMQSKNSNFEEH